jgi:1,5-anhydro-D-fructose reductase (1,5-anhydro-D-mannitol-forming)
MLEKPMILFSRNMGILMRNSPSELETVPIFVPVRYILAKMMGLPVWLSRTFPWNDWYAVESWYTRAERILPAWRSENRKPSKRKTKQKHRKIFCVFIFLLFWLSTKVIKRNNFYIETKSIIFMESIRWGMIGCGDVTEKKSAPSFNKVNGSSLYGVFSRTESRAMDYAARHQVPHVYDSAGSLVNDPAIDAVYVATPPSSHAEYAILAMRAGKPVYVEKPMAVDYRGCVEMNQVASETGVPLFVAYYRRSMDYFLKVKELLQQQAIGKVLMVQSSLILPPREEDLDRLNLPWRVRPEISGGGYFYDMGCHALDILSFCFGKYRSAEGWYANTGGLYPAEDTITASLVFENGLLYTGSWCFVAAEESSTDVIEIIGDRGRIRFSCFQFSPIEWMRGKDHREFAIDPPVHVQLPMIRTVVEELLGQGTCPSRGDSAAHINWVMDKILGKLS